MTPTHAHAQTYKHTRTPVRKHTHTKKGVHTDTRTHTHTFNTHTHTHARTRVHCTPAHTPSQSARRLRARPLGARPRRPPPAHHRRRREALAEWPAAPGEGEGIANVCVSIRTRAQGCVPTDRHPRNMLITNTFGSSSWAMSARTATMYLIPSSPPCRTCHCGRARVGSDVLAHIHSHKLCIRNRPQQLSCTRATHRRVCAHVQQLVQHAGHQVARQVQQQRTQGLRRRLSHLPMCVGVCVGVCVCVCVCGVWCVVCVCSHVRVCVRGGERSGAGICTHIRVRGHMLGT